MNRNKLVDILTSSQDHSEELYLKAIKQSASLIEYIDTKSQLVCLEAVKKSGSVLQHLSEQDMSYEVLMTAINKSGSSLKYVPPNLITEEMLVNAVQNSHSAIKYIPTRLLVEDILIKLAKTNGNIIQYIQKKHLTVEICLSAVKNIGTSFTHVPRSLHTQQMCIIAFENGFWDLKHIKKEYQTIEICHTSINQRGSYLYYVREDLISEALCKEALADDRRALEAVPKKLLESKSLLSLAAECGCELYYVPEHLRAYDLCLSFIQAKGQNIAYTPDEIIDYKLAKTSLTKENYYPLLEYIPTVLIDNALAELAINSNVLNIMHVPEQLATDALWKKTVEFDGSIIKHVNNPSEDLCIAAVTQSGNFLRYINAKNQTEAIIDAAEKYNPNAKKWIKISQNNSQTQNSGHQPLIKSSKDEVAYLKSLPYKDYLKTKYWGEVRTIVQKHYKLTCQLCGGKTAPFHVHHNNYEHRGEESLLDVILLCENDHKKFHGI